jgi:chromodomain-helicase-DNA-binding protein 1
MSTSPEGNLVNGHVSPMQQDDSVVTYNPNHSDSDLSDVQAADDDAPSPDSADADGSPEKPELMVQEPSESNNSDASGDADFDMVDSPASAQNISENRERASSSESRSATKRKASHLVEDDYMRENPELYGLRRSVRTSSAAMICSPC